MLAVITARALRPGAVILPFAAGHVIALFRKAGWLPGLRILELRARLVHGHLPYLLDVGHTLVVFNDLVGGSA